MKKKYGIDETKKLFESLTLIAKSVIKIKETGLNISSLGHLIELAKEHEALIDGLDDLDIVLKEIKDLDLEEAQELIAHIVSKVKEIEAEF